MQQEEMEAMQASEALTAAIRITAGRREEAITVARLPTPG